MCKEVAQVLRYCPEPLVQAVRALDPEQQEKIEELRLRLGQSVFYGIGGREWLLQWNKKPLLVDSQMLQTVLNRATSFSRYAAESSLKRGYFTVEGGHRIGVCGTVQYLENRWTIQEPSSISIRIARQVNANAERAINLIWSHPRSTLLIGPPGCGKTTLLRELIRQLSDRFSFRVCVVDERGELGAVLGGLPQFELGRHTDILSGAEKAQGIELVLRSMNPQWIVVDEITAAQDIRAMVSASYCGVRLLASAHADTKEDLHRRKLYRELTEQKLFENLIVMDEGKKIFCERISL